MNFADDTESALVFAASLVNTARGGAELLPDQEELTRFLDADKWTGRRDGTQSELEAVRTLRPRLRKFWEVTEVDDAVVLVNTLLGESGAQPRLARHDELGWHLHVTADDAPLVNRMAAEAAMGVLDLIRTGNSRACSGVLLRIVTRCSSICRVTARSDTATPETAGTGRTSPPTVPVNPGCDRAVFGGLGPG